MIMPDNLSVSIIGAGSGGCAFAAYLSSKKIEAVLYGHPEHNKIL